MRGLIIQFAIAATIVGFFVGAIAAVGAVRDAEAYASAAVSRTLQPAW
jgi:hypothetical protein